MPAKSARSLLCTADCGPDCVEHAAALFNCKTPPSITIGDYVVRICQYSNSSFESFVIALAYIERFQQMSGIKLSPLNIHRISITAVMIAAKFFDDLHWDNTAFARIGGISTREVNKMELELLHVIGFHIKVNEADFHRAFLRLCDEAHFLHPAIAHFRIDMELYQRQLGAEFNVESVAEGVAKLRACKKQNTTREAEPVGENTREAG